jgi:hypothetical protein
MAMNNITFRLMQIYEFQSLQKHLNSIKSSIDNRTPSHFLRAQAKRKNRGLKQSNISRRLNRMFSPLKTSDYESVRLL